jgi:hypothetical protein
MHDSIHQRAGGILEDLRLRGVCRMDMIEFEPVRGQLLLLVVHLYTAISGDARRGLPAAASRDLLPLPLIDGPEAAADFHIVSHSPAS